MKLVRLIKMCLNKKYCKVCVGKDLSYNFHNEELHSLYTSPNIIRMIKLRKMRFEGHVARMGEKCNAYRIWAGKPKGK
jgi:hypothetical protein